MAANTSVLKLVVDDKEYDSSIKRARQGMDALEKSLRDAGKSFTEVDKGIVEYTRSIGKMNTAASGAKGGLKEMTQTITDLSVQYSKLSDKEKNSPFGKALSESISELKDRARDLNGVISETEASIKSTGGILGQFADKLTVNIDAVKLLNGALSAAKGALSVAKDAFFANEQNLDEWGRTVKSCESLYDGFLASLNNGNVGGFLANIDDIVAAAREAYDALDELGTFNAFNQVNKSKSQAGFQEAINAYRLDPSDVNRVMLNAKFSTLRGNLSTRQGIERSAYEKEIARVAAQRGVSAKDLQDALSGSWGNYKSLKALPMTGKGYTSIGGGNFGVTQTVQVAAPANDAERLGQALRQLNDTELQYLQSLGAAANSTSLEIASIEKQMIRATRAGSRTGGGGGGGGGGRSVVSALSTGSSWSGTIADYALQIRGLQAQQQQATSHAQYAALQQQIDYIQQQIDFISGKSGASIGTSIMGMGSSSVKAAQEAFNNQQLNVSMVDGPVKQLENGANTVKMSWQDAASAIQGVGAAFSMIEDPAAKVVGIIGQAVATIALGFAQATAQAAAGGPLAWIAAVAGGMGTMISTIAAIKQATAGSYAEGGIVPGNNYNDGLIANVSSGELILNAAQQRNVANNLIGQRANTRPYVDAETIVLGVNNYLRRSGRGELVTTR